MVCIKSAFYNIYLAVSMLDKTQGMIFRENLFENSVLFIPNCNWVHSFFIKSNIFLYFVDKDLELVQKNILLSPWRFSPIVVKAKHVIESKIELSEEHLKEILSALKN